MAWISKQCFLHRRAYRETADDVRLLIVSVILIAECIVKSSSGLLRGQRVEEDFEMSSRSGVEPSTDFSSVFNFSTSSSHSFRSSLSQHLRDFWTVSE
jgi:hypothetical protein